MPKERDTNAKRCQEKEMLTARTQEEEIPRERDDIEREFMKIQGKEKSRERDAKR